MATSKPPAQSTPAGAATERPAWQQHGIRVGIVLGLVLLVLLVGWLLGRAQVSELRTQVQTLEQQRTFEASRANANEALALLYRAALDLDARNFGVANDRLNAAAELLNRADAAALGVSEQALADLQQSLAQTDLRVAEDLEPQRAQVLRFAAELRDLVGIDAAR